MTSPSVPPVDWTAYDAVLFDLDGVLTPTAEVHMHAWRAMFQAFLDEVNAHRGAGDPEQAAYSDQDYFDQIDGKPRYDGVRSFLASRGIELPDGEGDDAADQDHEHLTVSGLGNRKNAVFAKVLADDGVAAYPGSVALLDELAARRTEVAVVSSSRNAPAVLAAAGLADRFEVVVDGAVAGRRGLPGKPAPDTFLFAAQQLGVPAARAVVVEDALSGVAAGRAGDFALVLGVDRGVGRQSLLGAGADVVVADLAETVGARA